jgi:hypothetical protein
MVSKKQSPILIRTLYIDLAKSVISILSKLGTLVLVL